MRTDHFPIGHWVMYTFIGWFAGIILILALSALFDSTGIEGLQFYLGIGMGAGVGFFQWKMLKKSIPVTQQWIAYSVIGLGVPFLFFDLLKFTSISLGTYYILVSLVSGGLLTGFLQSLILKKFISAYTRWIPVSLLGWMLAGATVFSIDFLKPYIHNNWVAFGINLTLIHGGGVVLGVITGNALSVLLKRNC